MFKAFLLAFGFILSSCTYAPNDNPPPQQTRQDNTGDVVQRQLTERYNDTRANCGLPSHPAFLCSGVIIRATAYSPNYHVWDNSINSHQKGSVSFSYLRRDSQFRSTSGANGNGYIFLPPFYANGKLTPELLCSFPLNGATDYRDDRGCGVSPDAPLSAPCQSLGITTARGWYENFMIISANICGFATRNVLGAGATTAFIATLEARQLVLSSMPYYFGQNNEVVLAIWPNGQGNNLPLQAFFYEAGQSGTGRMDAQNNQLDFKNTTGLSVPVIAITMPESNEDNVAFNYLPADQVVALP
ncbi:hypothetical protein [Pseudomonas sp. ICMP 561]|uniref:hypothetical protein n=1 Tax=Pseudomonas sp. ICMP 561 TaxID=1718918 RepID=UPI0011452F47|nr:hypothetical protein [Pseudomonas sp. ICMP 561]